MKTCAICNTLFYETNKNNLTKFCSRRCYLIYYNRIKKRPSALTKNCLHCQQEFTVEAKFGKKKYCSDKCNLAYWRDNNREHHRESQRQYKRSHSLSCTEKIKHTLRSRLKHAIAGNHKSGSAVRDLGCTVEELKVYLESKFQEGMTWDNWGRKGWHIDHITPLSSFDLTDPEQLKKACHYTNLQPLWARDNLSKGNKVPVTDSMIESEDIDATAQIL